MSLAAKQLLDRIYTRANSSELTLKQLRKAAVHMVVEDNGGNKSWAADSLQIGRPTLLNTLKRRCHKCGEICCRCWVLLIVMFALGCKTSEKAQSHKMLLPPMPRTAVAVQEWKDEGYDEVMLGPIAPKRLMLMWEKGDTNPDTVTEIWTVDIYSGEITFFAETMGTTLELWADQPAQFFIARNRLYGVVSEWNIILE